MQFLRTKKYDFTRAKDLFEKYMLLKFTFPKWFNYSEDERKKFWELFDTGFITPLKNRDEEGRSVIFIQAQKLDPKKFDFADILRLITRVAQIMLEEEETQISGFVVIVDCTNVNFSHYALFPLADVVNFVKIIRMSSVGRHKKMIMVNLPSYATIMLDIAKRVMSEKLRSRILLLKDMAELENEIDTSILPSEVFNGNDSQFSMLESFKLLSNQREEIIKSINDGVDWERVEFENDNESCSIM